MGALMWLLKLKSESITTMNSAVSFSHQMSTVIVSLFFGTKHSNLSFVLIQEMIILILGNSRFHKGLKVVLNSSFKALEESNLRQYYQRPSKNVVN